MRPLITLLGLVSLVVAACGGTANGENSTPDGTSTPPPSPTATATPVPELTARDIVERSSEAMAEAESFVVTSLRSHRTRMDVEERVEVLRYDGLEVQVLWRHFDVCHTGTYEQERRPFIDRAEGALAVYEPRTGATAPETFELLGEEEMQGHPAWKVRYRYLLPSIEGPYPIEHTEWVAQDDFRLLRVETEVYDPFGFVGTTVRIFDRYGDPAPECPMEPDYDEGDLAPLTEFRLESPYG